MNGFYENTGFVNKRNRKQILILDVDDSSDNHLGTGGEFKIELFEPLIIDTLSEVYLDNFISFNSNITNDPSNSAFVLKINEFNINSNVASSSDNNTIFNSIIIPNEHSSVSNNHAVVVHKGKKFNYICDVNPGKIGSITGSITNLNGSPIFHGPEIHHVYTYALIGIDKLESSGVNFPIPVGFGFTAISGGGLTGITDAIGIFIAYHTDDATTLHFASNKVLLLPNRSTMSDIVFTVSGGSYTVSNTGSENPNLALITNPGRFIAEFSINSRE